MNINPRDLNTYLIFYQNDLLNNDDEKMTTTTSSMTMTMTMTMKMTMTKWFCKVEALLVTWQSESNILDNSHRCICYICNLDLFQTLMWHLGQHKFSVWLTCQNTWIPKADLLLKILRGKSAFKDLITQSVKSTRTKIWNLINIVNQILNWWKIPSEMEVALRYTLPTLFALLTLLALSTLSILWTGLDGVDGLDTP